MPDPYQVLGVSPSSSDADIRESYLALVRRFPPERAPDEFRRIQAAYEAVKDLRSRLRYFLFEPTRGETLEGWLEEIRAESASARWSLARVRGLYCPPTGDEGERASGGS